MQKGKLYLHQTQHDGSSVYLQVVTSFLSFHTSELFFFLFSISNFVYQSLQDAVMTFPVRKDIVTALVVVILAVSFLFSLRATQIYKLLCLMVQGHSYGNDGLALLLPTKCHPHTTWLAGYPALIFLN